MEVGERQGEIQEHLYLRWAHQEAPFGWGSVHCTSISAAGPWHGPQPQFPDLETKQ